MKIRRDEFSLFIQGRMGKGDAPYRPGAVPGYSHAFDMSNRGIEEGDNLKTHHVAGAPLIKITLADGRVVHWCSTDNPNHPLKGR